MTAKESAIWLRVLSREEALVQQPSSDNGTSGITKPPPRARGKRRQAAASSDSDYDVNGVDDSGVSVSSNENGSQAIDTGYSTPNPLADKVKPKKQPKGKRQRKEVNSADPRTVPHSQENPDDMPANNFPDKNHCHDGMQLLGSHGYESRQEHNLMGAFRVVGEDIEGHADFLNYLAAPPTNVVSTLSMSVAGKPLLDPPVQIQPHNNATYDFYGMPEGYGPGNVGQRLLVEPVAPQIKPKGYGSYLDGSLGMDNTLTGVDLGEKDLPFDFNFGSPLNCLSLNFGTADSPFPSMASLDYFGFEENELIKHFAA